MLAMDEEEAGYYLADIENEIVPKMLEEWKKAKGTDKLQSWRVIPAATLIKEWKYNHATGLTHEKIIDKFQDICIENYVKLWANTVLFGHTSLSVDGYLEQFYDDITEKEAEELLEDYEWFACDGRGNWRISDYGLETIGNCASALLQTDDYNRKLYIIDCILNVAHQRSDLASWFVEGGTSTLNKLSD